MNWSAAPLPAAESEFALAGLRHSPGRVVDAPVVDAAPLVFECRYCRTVKIPRHKPSEGDNYVIIGEVVSVRVSRSVLDSEGAIDVQKLRPVARLGYSQEYSVIRRVSHSADP